MVPSGGRHTNEYRCFMAWMRATIALVVLLGACSANTAGSTTTSEPNTQTTEPAITTTTSTHPTTTMRATTTTRPVVIVDPPEDDRNTFVLLALLTLNATSFSTEEVGTDTWPKMIYGATVDACYALADGGSLSDAMLAAVEYPLAEIHARKDPGEGFSLVLAIIPSGTDVYCPSVSPVLPSDSDESALLLTNAWQVAMGREPIDTEGWITDGTWQVGVDIEPGTYRNSGSDGCYWERLSGFSGESSDRIANGFPDGDPALVTIQPTDVGFHSEDCGRWTPTE